MNGYTLIEVLFAISISSILMIATVQFMGTALPVYRSTYLHSLADETAQVQLRRITREIREARPSDSGAYPLVAADPQKVIFYANVDDDTATERVRYELIGTTLVRGITEPTGFPIVYNLAQESVSTVARSIYNGTTPLFSYYGSDYPEDKNPLVLP
jgi:prepilin-type N-terminal cleavage/methylation domain-containing protein